MNKTINQKAWYFVIPVFVLVAFNAAIPLMTVVNYSFQETFGNNVFAWEGTRWFKQILLSERFHASLGRQFRSEERRVGKECRSRWSPYH